MRVGIKLEQGAIMPSYAKSGDSGADIFALEDIVIPAGVEGMMIPTGVSFEIPLGYEIQVRPKSGVSTKTAIRVIFGTVDSGYRGVVGVMVDNISNEDILVPRGKAIAQLVLSPVIRMEFVQKQELKTSDRGKGGFGSTGRGL